MYNLTSNLIVYIDKDRADILFTLSDIIKEYNESSNCKETIRKVYQQINKLLDLATRYGFDKNLWHNYLAYIIATTENPFSIITEKVGEKEGSVNLFVKNDLKIFKDLFDYDFTKLENSLNINCFTIISNYKSITKSEQIYNKSVSEKVRELSSLIDKAKDEEEVFYLVTDFYKRYGVGKFGLNKAFRVSTNKGEDLIYPITTSNDIILDDLVGYEMQKQKLIQNTQAFVEGKKANNVLLYGDAGTGKSTSIKAILNQYYDKGLRMIEVYKHEFKELHNIIAEIKNRNYKFIIYMDDLSFEEFETDYKYLKAVIEGGLESKPENILVYATSNRRHLIRETWSDRNDVSSDDLHRFDTMQEKLSLVDRFGITIGYYKPNQKEFYDIVTSLASRYEEITLSEEEIIDMARKWEMRSGGMSGRVAQQFINYLLGSNKN